MPNTSKMTPDSQFPVEAIAESIQVAPPVASNMGATLTFLIASAADSIIPWGMNQVMRDRQLRDFWPTESYLAGAVANVSFRNAGFDWEIKGDSQKVNQVVTDMLMRSIAGDKIGWSEFVKKFSQDLYTTDNGAFIELIRDPGMDVNSKFKAERAPVIGIAHLDSGKCTRTGNVEVPVLYTDRNSKLHKLKWYEVIPFSEFPSANENMNGVGYCSVTRALRMAQIMRSIAIFKDEEVSGRNIKKINIVGGVGRTQIEDALARTTENANNRGQMRYIEHSILASLDPEKAVSLVTVDLASLPEGFNYDQEMQWYIAALALDFGVDYQEFAPLPGGQIGSSAQSAVLDKKSSGKGPRNWMDSISEGFTNYGVLPRGTTMIFNDKNEQEELERQVVRTKASEEAAILVNSKIFSPKAVAMSLVRRGIYEQEDIDNTDPEWWKAAMEPKAQPVGDRGGNTLQQDAKRTDAGKPKPNSSDRLLKEIEDTTLLEDVRALISKAFSRRPEVNVTVNNPAQPAPVINQTINTPQQEPPTVIVKPSELPPMQTPNIYVTNQVQPAKVDVKVPHATKQRQTVNRDDRGNIESTDTVFEYKE